MPQGASLLFHSRKGKTRSLMCSMRWWGGACKCSHTGTFTCREPTSSRAGLPEDVVPGEGGSLGSARRPTTRDSKPIADPFPPPGPAGPPLPDSPAQPALLSQQVLSPCHLQGESRSTPTVGSFGLSSRRHLSGPWNKGPMCCFSQQPGTHGLLPRLPHVLIQLHLLSQEPAFSLVWSVPGTHPPNQAAKSPFHRPRRFVMAERSASPVRLREPNGMFFSLIPGWTLRTGWPAQGP